jgi:Zn-dependent protease with chaperone function
MEVAADEEALAAVNALYGHVNGASTLFALFSANRGDSGSKGKPVWLERFLSTHPRDEDRIDSISRSAAENHWQVEGAVTPLPADFQNWLGTR